MAVPKEEYLILEQQKRRTHYKITLKTQKTLMELENASYG